MKSSFSILALSLSSALLAACAVEPAAPAAAGATEAAAASSDLICGREYMTGSNIAQTKCRTREQAEAEKDAATRSLGRTTGGPNAKQGGS
jgi:hypothetical protein